MKTIEYFKERREEIYQEGNALRSAKHKKSEYQKVKKKMQDNDMYLKYIESSPSEEYLKKELKRLENRLSLISAKSPRKEEFLDESGEVKLLLYRQRRDEYNKTMGVSEVRKQISAIRYILND